MQYYIEENVIVGDNVTIEPFAVIKGNTVLRDGCVIGSFSYIDNSEIGENTVVKSSRICDSIVGRNCSIGPNAHLRERARIEDNCRVGNFVEIKKARCAAALRQVIWRMSATRMSALIRISDAELFLSITTDIKSTKLLLERIVL